MYFACEFNLNFDTFLNLLEQFINLINFTNISLIYCKKQHKHKKLQQLLNSSVRNKRLRNLFTIYYLVFSGIMNLLHFKGSKLLAHLLLIKRERQQYFKNVLSWFLNVYSTFETGNKAFSKIEKGSFLLVHWKQKNGKMDVKIMLI